MNSDEGGGAAQLDRAEGGRVVVNSHVLYIQYNTTRGLGEDYKQISLCKLSPRDMERKMGKLRHSEELEKKEKKQQKHRLTR